MKVKTAEKEFMTSQKKWCPKCNNYTLPEQWQLDAMETYAKKIAYKAFKAGEIFVNDKQKGLDVVGFYEWYSTFSHSR